MADRNRGRRKPGRGRESGRDDRDRAFADRAQDEVRSWFGDERSVTISGTVADRWQKRRAEDVTDLVSGVREVHNRLRVARPEGS